LVRKNISEMTYFVSYDVNGETVTESVRPVNFDRFIVYVIICVFV